MTKIKKKLKIKANRSKAVQPVGRPRRDRKLIDLEGYRASHYEKKPKKKSLPSLKVKFESDESLTLGEKRFFEIKNFIEKYLTYPTGPLTGQKFVLQSWQLEILGELFGTLNPDGSRQYRRAYISMGRKNAKTTLCSCIVLYFLLIESERERNMEIISCALDSNQAAIVFRLAAAMVLNNPELRNRLKVIPFTKRITNERTNSYYQVISSEVKSHFGLGPKLVIFDEIHNQPNSELWDVLEKSMGAMREPLMIGITTSGYDRESLCYRLYSYGKSIAEGKVQDPTFYFKVFELDEGDDWKLESNWYKANPGLGTFRSLEEMRSAYQKVLSMPIEESSFKNQYLNMWTSSETRWISMDRWDACGHIPVDPEKLVGLPCWAGLDLGISESFTCITLLFKGGDYFYVVTYYFLPKDGIEAKEKRDDFEYRFYTNRGIIELTEGDVTDFSLVEDRLVFLREKYNFQILAVDPWHINEVQQGLARRDFKIDDIIAIPQNKNYMGVSNRKLEELILAGKIQHGGDRVLRWMFDHTSIDERAYREGHIILQKSTRNSRIDGIISLSIALRGYLHRPEPAGSCLETEGLRYLDISEGRPKIVNAETGVEVGIIRKCPQCSGAVHRDDMFCGHCQALVRTCPRHEGHFPLEDKGTHYACSVCGLKLDKPAPRKEKES